MNVDSVWSFRSNWFDNDAELVDDEGNGRKISTFRLEEGQTSPIPQIIDWLDFSSRKAEEFAQKQDQQQMGLKALEIVSGHMHVETETISPDFAIATDEQTNEPTEDP